MSDHDAISDDGTRVVCACGRSWEGHDARDKHVLHWRVERARSELRGEGKETDA